MENIADKIAKLLAHAQSAEEIGSLAEAESFAAQAHRLMLKHHIGLDEVEYAEHERTETVDREWLPASEFGFNDSTRRITWVEHLAGAVAKAHFCKAFGLLRSNKLQFIGAPTHRKVAIQVFLKLMAARDTLGKQEYNRMRKEGLDTKGFWSGWNKGFAAGVSEKVCAEMREAKKELETEQDETALVRIGDALAKVDDWASKNLNFAKNASFGTNYGSARAYSKGKAAGRGSSFSRKELT